MTDRTKNQGGPSTLIADLESEIEDLSDRSAACKKAMAASKFALSCGALLSIAVIAGLIHFQPVLMTLAITAFIGGIVGFGSNRGTLIETQARIKVLNLRRLELIDTIRMRVIED